jgi:hypothetical protein
VLLPQPFHSHSLASLSGTTKNDHKMSKILLILANLEDSSYIISTF